MRATNQNPMEIKTTVQVCLLCHKLGIMHQKFQWNLRSLAAPFALSASQGKGSQRDSQWLHLSTVVRSILSICSAPPKQAKAARGMFGACILPPFCGWLLLLLFLLLLLLSRFRVVVLSLSPPQGEGGGCGRRDWKKCRKMREKCGKCSKKSGFVKMLYDSQNPYVYQDAC